MQRNLNIWDLFEFINGRSLHRVCYLGIPCSVRAIDWDMALVMPCDQFIDIGMGPGNSRWIDKAELDFREVLNGIFQ